MSRTVRLLAIAMNDTDAPHRCGLLSPYAAYVVALLGSEPSHLYPAALLTSGMLFFYGARFVIADHLLVSGPRSAGDVVLALLSVAELAVLTRGARRRHAARRGLPL